MGELASLLPGGDTGSVGGCGPSYRAPTALKLKYHLLLQKERAVDRLMQAIDVLFERPILGIRQMEAAMRIPYRSAQRYVEKLENLGILREVTGRARNRLYQADEILTVLG